MKVLNKVSTKQAVKKLGSRAVGCSPHTMCPKCLVRKG